MSEAFHSSSSTFSINRSMPRVSNCSALPVRQLVTSRRWDIAVKHRLFCHYLHGGDPDAERVYRWTIEKRSGHRMAAGLATDKWKKSVDHYLISAKALLSAMAREGFDPRFAVPIDPDGELLDGSHRVACALALEVEEVPVSPQQRYVWAPAWGYEWFVENGMGDLESLREDWRGLVS